MTDSGIALCPQVSVATEQSCIIVSSEFFCVEEKKEPQDVEYHAYAFFEGFIVERSGRQSVEERTRVLRRNIRGMMREEEYFGERDDDNRHLRERSADGGYFTPKREFTIE